ncbi:hypothetical protein Tco_1202728 [Tanacetum coccineum]
MANLEFCDKHNMVAYLKKPTGSEGFQEIVDFLNGSHIRYALTKNPTIYVSLIKKFWQTATVRTVDNGEQEITATVDGKEFTITEASVRRHLQLADVDGISVLPTTKIFDQLSLMGMIAIQAEEGEGSRHPSKPQPPSSTAQPTNEEPIPNVTSEPILNVPDEAVYEKWDDRVERATTTTTSLDAEQTSEAIGGSIAQTRSERVPTPPRDSPLPRVNTLGSDEGSMTLQELTVLCTTLFKKVENLEADLKQTNKGRMIEEINQDAGVTLVTPTHSQEDQPEDQLLYEDQPEDQVNICIPSPVCNQDKCKGKMEESEDEQIKRTNLQQEQDRLSHEAAVRLQEELDEEER